MDDSLGVYEENPDALAPLKVGFVWYFVGILFLAACAYFYVRFIG